MKLKKELTARCHFMGANVATLYLALMMINNPEKWIKEHFLEIDLFIPHIEKIKDVKKHIVELQLKDKKIALYTGHLYKWKGAHIFAETAKELPELDFYIVGGTDVDLKRFKEKYNFKNLKYIGWQSHDEMPDWMNAVDVLILPNCGEHLLILPQRD